MGLFRWFFGKSPPPAAAGSKRYEYPTGNIELAIRIQRGEYLQAVMGDIKPRWTPGNEYLWDEYDPESLVDGPEKQWHAVNCLLYGRLCVYRALRAAGNDVRGRDPFQFVDQVPEVMAQLRARFPRIYEEGAKPNIQLRAVPLELSPGDPGLGATETPGPKP